MGRGRNMNEVIREQFDRVSSDAEDRKQTGVKPTEDMSVQEFITEGTIVVSRLTEVFEELSTRAEAAASTQEEGEQPPPAR